MIPGGSRGRIVTDPDALVERILASSPSVVTVDVFDTLLYRLCQPATVIERACADLAARARCSADDVLVTRRRIVGRLKASARRRGFDREWRIREALKRILARIGLPSDPEAVEEEVRAELELERIALAPGPGMAEVLAAVRREGYRIHFVSDIYLSRQDVVALLAAHGLSRFLEGGFVSSEPLLGKTTGRLFGHVAAELGVAPETITHFGNHPKSDLAMPDRVGVRSFWYLDRAHVRRMATLAVAERRRSTHGRAVYRHLARRTAQMCRSPRVKDEAMFEVGRSVAAPLAAHLALHVLEAHAARPFRKILFMAREGLPFLAAARRMARALDMEVEEDLLTYAMISRAVTMLPASDPDDPLSSGHWVIGTKSRITSARGFLAQFLLPGEMIDEFVPAGEDEARETIDRLGRDARFLAALGRERQRQTALLERYLRSIGALGPGRVAVVDVGWAGSTQDAMARLFPPPDGPEIVGHYLGLTNRGEAPRPGSTKEGFLIDQWNEGASRLGVQLTAGAVRVCEVLFRAMHGTTVGYEEAGGRIVAKLGPSARDELPEEVVESIGSLWMGFVEGLEDAARAARLETHRPLSSNVLARGIMHRFLSYPTREEARALVRIPHVQDAGQGLMDSIGPDGLRGGTAWIPGVLSTSGLHALQPAFDLVCYGYEVARVTRELVD